MPLVESGMVSTDALISSFLFDPIHILRDILTLSTIFSATHVKSRASFTQTFTHTHALNMNV